MNRLLLILLFNFILSEVDDGYILISTGGISPVRQTTLLDHEENIVNNWIHDTKTSSIAYITSDSILFVPCKIDSVGGGAGPIGGRFKKINWQGEIIWDYILPNDICIPHHDIAVLPNGNFLAICYETKSHEEAINAGMIDIDGPLTLDMIIEIQPLDNNNANIIWKWHFWDHLIQDIDPSYDNYGDVQSNPQLLDINCSTSGNGGGGLPGEPDWNHLNCISYNPILDQIVISSRHMNEIYIIDHSTTLEEASSHEGGLYGMGGDLLYRWGNPQNYNRGSDFDNILDAQHGVNWIENGYLGEGNLILFNNNHSPGNSAVIEIITPIDVEGNYFINDTDPFGPSSYYWIYESDFYSNKQSGAFRVSNGNTFVTSSDDNKIFEVNQLGEIEWEYGGGVSSVRVIKYPSNYFHSMIYGDLNNDVIVDILDVIVMVNIILGDGEYIDIGDLNEDLIINLLDIIILTNIIISY